MDYSLLAEGGDSESMSRVGGVGSDAEVEAPGTQEPERFHNVDWRVMQGPVLITSMACTDSLKPSHFQVLLAALY